MITWVYVALSYGLSWAVHACKRGLVASCKLPHGVPGLCCKTQPYMHIRCTVTSASLHANYRHIT